MTELTIYIVGVVLWFWFMPKYAYSRKEELIASYNSDGIPEIKVITLFGIFWPMWVFILIVMMVFYPICYLFNKYINYRTKS